MLGISLIACAIKALLTIHCARGDCTPDYGPHEITVPPAACTNRPDYVRMLLAPRRATRSAQQLIKGNPFLTTVQFTTVRDVILPNCEYSR